MRRLLTAAGLLLAATLLPDLALAQDVGEAHESMPVDFHGEPMEIGFNAEFLRDGIESVEGDTVKLKLTSPLRPGLVQGEDGSFSYLIMPIRLST